MLSFFQCWITNYIGLFQKISTPPLWTTLNWVLKYFRISKNDSSRFCRIPNLADSKYWEIPEFYKTFNDFRRIPVKIHKIWGKFMDFQSSLLSIFDRIPNVVHGEGGADIFWNSPLHASCLISSMVLEIFFMFDLTRQSLNGLPKAFFSYFYACLDKLCYSVVVCVYLTADSPNSFQPCWKQGDICLTR